MQTQPLELFDGKHHYFEGLTIDLRSVPPSQLDEAVGVTYGASAVFRDCHIRGAGKLFLCGSGDAHMSDDECGKQVVLIDCVLEDFGRRGPEVQSGMVCHMRGCTIRNWGEPTRWDTRCFGAWAHKGGEIIAEECRFEQPRFWRGWRVMWRDLVGHVGQAWNDEGLRGLFRLQTWIPGVCRGLTAGPGGKVRAVNCTSNKWWIRIEGQE